MSSDRPRTPQIKTPPREGPGKYVKTDRARTSTMTAIDRRFLTLKNHSKRKTWVRAFLERDELPDGTKTYKTCNYFLDSKYRNNEIVK
jgi:hypothetical protein